MAAPHLAGPSGSGQHTPHDHPDRQPDRSGAEQRSEVIAQLAARLAAAETRDRAAAAATRPYPAVLGIDGPEPGAHTGTGLHPQWAAGAEQRAHPNGGPTVPIGANGSARSDRRRGAGPGGHPEDQPGDPEAVAKAICLRQLTAAARPRAALAATLRQRGIPDDVAGRVLDRFVEVGLIDDRAYAEAFVAAKHRERALGVTALRTELRRKGVDDQIVDVAVQAVDQDAERDRATALIARRVDAAMAGGVPAARRRLVGLLARRGYSAELACQVVDDALAAYEAEDDHSRW